MGRVHGTGGTAGLPPRLFTLNLCNWFLFKMSLLRGSPLIISPMRHGDQDLRIALEINLKRRLESPRPRGPIESEGSHSLICDSVTDLRLRIKRHQGWS